jgi:hypothetical protein
MSALEKAINEVVKDQNPISDFIGAVPSETGVSEKKEKAIEAAPVSKNSKRGRGRPKGTGKKQKRAAQKSFVPDDLSSDIPQSAPPGENPPLDAPGVDTQRNNAALGATMLVETSGRLIAGDDGKMSQDEFSNIQQNFDRYFETKGITDFPPGISLGLALGGYYIRTLTTEKSLPKVVLFWAWLKTKLSFRRKKQETKQEENPQDGA